MIKINQVALHVPDQLSVVSGIENVFELKDSFYFDNLMMDGEFNSRSFHSVKIDLGFNFSVIENDLELELITSRSEAHWHREVARKMGTEFFLSHLGSYCNIEEMESMCVRMAEMGVKTLQSTVSRDHSNLRESGVKRSYKDVIFDTESILGFRLKLSTDAE